MAARSPADGEELSRSGRTKRLQRATTPARKTLAEEWRRISPTSIPQAHADEDAARASAELFTRYLRAARDEAHALSALPPGRFLMPGDLEGSPALTFAPLPLSEGDKIRRGFARRDDGASLRGL